MIRSGKISRRRTTRRTRAGALALAALCVAALPAGAQRRGPSIPVEVFAGRLNFSDDVGLPGQELAGVRLGLDVADYVGLRGFYLRGINDDRSGVAPIQAFGGEAQLNLNAGNGVTPFLVGGVGRLDFLDGYVGADSLAPEDRNFGLAGAGLRLDVWRVGLQLAARSLLFETEEGDEGESRDLRSNLLYSAGVAFRLGGRAERAAVAAPPPVPVVTVAGTGRDSVVYVRDGETVRVVEGPERTVTLPVPREGELYVRYGPVDTLSLVRGGARAPSAATGTAPAPSADVVAAQVLAALEPRLRDLLSREREIIRDIVRAEVARETARGLSPEAERRLLARVEALVAQRGSTVVVTPGAPGTAVVAAPVAEPVERAERFRPGLRGVRLLAGMNVDRPRQGVVGLRVDLGPLRPSRPSLRILPELSLGFGQGGASIMLAGNFHYDLRTLRVRGAPVTPYVFGGPGVLFFTDPPRGRPGQEAVLNVGYGITAPLPHLGADRRVFLEHQGIDFFDLNRVLVGIRL